MHTRCLIRKLDVELELPGWYYADNERLEAEPIVSPEQLERAEAWCILRNLGKHFVGLRELKVRLRIANDPKKNDA
jgi:hypothetical protein